MTLSSEISKLHQHQVCISETVAQYQSITIVHNNIYPGGVGVNPSFPQNGTIVRCIDHSRRVGINLHIERICLLAGPFRFQFSNCIYSMTCCNKLYSLQIHSGMT